MYLDSAYCFTGLSRGTHILAGRVWKGFDPEYGDKTKTSHALQTKRYIISEGMLDGGKLALPMRRVAVTSTVHEMHTLRHSLQQKSTSNDTRS